MLHHVKCPVRDQPSGSGQQEASQKYPSCRFSDVAMKFRRQFTAIKIAVIEINLCEFISSLKNHLSWRPSSHLIIVSFQIIYVKKCFLLFILNFLAWLLFKLKAVRKRENPFYGRRDFLTVHLSKCYTYSSTLVLNCFEFVTRHILT